jgi:hypothetical protein
VGSDELDRPVSAAREERQQRKGRDRRGGGDEDDWCQQGNKQDALQRQEGAGRQRGHHEPVPVMTWVPGERGVRARRACAHRARQIR